MWKLWTCTQILTIGTDERNLKQHKSLCPCEIITCSDSVCKIRYERRNENEHKSNKCLGRTRQCKVCKQQGNEKKTNKQLFVYAKLFVCLYWFVILHYS
jgi:hypothetical protein